MDEMNSGTYMSDQAPKKTPGMAIASMVLGIVSVVIGCCYIYVGIPCAILSIVFAIITLRKGPQGKGMCIAGIVCSGVAIIVSISFLALGSVMLASFPELQDFMMSEGLM